MSSLIDIYNIAAVAIDQEPLTGPDEDSKLGRLCRSHYNNCRQFVLRSFPWNCARGRDQLAAMTTAPAFEFGNQYQVPADFLRVFSVNNNRNAKWSVEGVNYGGTVVTAILTDEGAPLQLRYIRDLIDVTKFDPMLLRAVGYDLGAEIALPMTGERTKRDSCLTALGEIQSAARLATMQENSSDEWDVDIWLQSRA